jgi:2-octaprenylphenol hydroxylase
MNDSATDVLIVGGGIVGLSLAARLGAAAIGVTLVDAREPVVDWPDGDVDLRVYAITRASERLFTDLGVWPRMLALGVSPFREMRVWDAGGSGAVHFDAAEVGQPHLGHIIESRVIVKALCETLAGMPGVTLRWNAPVQTFTGTGVTLADGGTLEGRLLVGADGAESRVRDAAGIHLREYDYGQRAIVAVVTTERHHQETAWQRFLPTGPLAFLPLADGRSSIVWSATRAEAERLMALDDENFCSALSQAFDHRLGRVVACGERGLFPLKRRHAAHYVKPGIALVGDAAHVIHPLAGQGVNLGLGDVQELADVVIDAVKRGRNPGDYAVLRRYERARKGANLAMMTAMDGFKHLFGVTAQPVRLLRSAGMNAVDAAGPLKHSIMRYAMGL